MINVLFCGNKGVFDGALTCALSCLMRTSATEPFRFYIFTMALPHLNEKYVCVEDGQIEFLKSAVKKFNAENDVVKTDVTQLYMRHFDGCPNEGAYCSPYTLIRLFADEVEGMPDKLLYLDIDVMFNRDILLLYNIDVENYEYAAARDHYGKYLVNPNYINAGVLLLNMKRIRETGLFKKARELLKKKKLMFADQSALIRSTTKRKVLPQRFNDQKFLHAHTVVRHFSKRLFYLPYPHTENIKQWHVAAVHKKFGYTAFDDIYAEYARLKSLYEKTDNKEST